MVRADRLTVVVPFYNEASTLRTALERLFKAQVSLPLEVIAVDDGSTDAGSSTIEDLVASGQVNLFVHDSNRGKGAALRTALSQATGDLVSILDADLEYDPSDLDSLLSPILAGEAEVVYGTRSFGSHTSYSFWYVVGNRFVALWTSLFVNRWLSDVMTCLKVAPLELWRSLELTSAGFEVEAEATAKFVCGGHEVFEVPISYTARSRAAGKKLRWPVGFKCLWVVVKARLSRRS